MASTSKQSGESSSRGKVIDIDLKLNKNSEKTSAEVRKELQVIDLSKKSKRSKVDYSQTPQAVRRVKKRKKKSKLSEAIFKVSVIIIIALTLISAFIVIGFMMSGKH